MPGTARIHIRGTCPQPPALHDGPQRGICAEAGLTDRSFYESFPSQEALRQAGTLSLIDELREGLQPAAALHHTTAAFEAWFALVSEPRRGRASGQVLGDRRLSVAA